MSLFLDNKFSFTLLSHKWFHSHHSEQKLIYILSTTFMKKASFIFGIVLMLSVAFESTAQTAAPADFFVGKWEILVIGTPNGDSKMIASLERSGANLTGQLINAADASAEKIPIIVEENGNKIGLAFSTQGYDVTIDLAKVDDDNLKGSLMNMFDATAKRIK